MLPTPEAILSATSDTDVREAMLVGSHLEGGWGPSYGVGDQGTSYGPFQIHLPAHPGVTAAEASNPAWAAGYMLGSYETAVGSVPASTWQTNPELASEQAAVAAERPAVPYYQSQGAGAVDAAWQATQGVLTGQPVSSSNPYASSGGASGAPNATTTGFSLNPVSDLKTALVWMVAMATGAGLVVIGLVKTASPGTKVSELPVKVIKGVGERAAMAPAAMALAE